MVANNDTVNAIATVSTSDLYRRFLSNEKTDREYLVMARWISVCAGVLMVAGALYLIEASTTTLQDTATIITALLAGGLLTIYLIGFFSRRCDARHIMLGIAATMTFTGWTIGFGDATYFPFDLYYTGLVGNIVMFVVAYGSSFVLPQRNPAD